MRVSTVDQHPETQLYDLRSLATQRGLEVVQEYTDKDDLNHQNIEFISFRENIDTGGPLGRAIVVIVGAIAELERNLIIERVRAGMRRAKLEGRQIGLASLGAELAGCHCPKSPRGMESHGRWSVKSSVKPRIQSATKGTLQPPRKSLKAGRRKRRPSVVTKL